MIAQVATEYGPGARNRLAAARQPDVEGARACLESFYHAFHNRDAAVLARVWLSDPLVQLDNPLGGIVRGTDEIVALYERIFHSAANVHVTFGDIVEFQVPGMVVFVGRETGGFDDPSGRTVDLRIRTTRVFAFDSERWGQVHHRGSIDDPGALRDYQEAVAASVADPAASTC
jgi:ketosteroid isomerase-like protein